MLTPLRLQFGSIGGSFSMLCLILQELYSYWLHMLNLRVLAFGLEIIIVFSFQFCLVSLVWHILCYS